jgi:hypothetical protein
MPNRREFCRAVAAATAGASVLGFANALGAAQAPARRQISIGGRRVRVIDVHAHCVIPEVAAVVKGTPFEAQAAAGGNNILGPARLQVMDAQGVDMQALSITASGGMAPTASCPGGSSRHRTRAWRSGSRRIRIASSR